MDKNWDQSVSVTTNILGLETQLLYTIYLNYTLQFLYDQLTVDLSTHILC